MYFEYIFVDTPGIINAHQIGTSTLLKFPLKHTYTEIFSWSASSCFMAFENLKLVISVRKSKYKKYIRKLRVPSNIKNCKNNLFKLMTKVSRFKLTVTDK